MYPTARDTLSRTGNICISVHDSTNMVTTNGNHEMKNTATIIIHINVNFLSSLSLRVAASLSVAASLRVDTSLRIVICAFCK